jgi:hypothetical protein
LKFHGIHAMDGQAAIMEGVMKPSGDRRRSFALRRLKESTQDKQVRDVNGVIRSVGDGLLRDLWSPITDWLGPRLHELQRNDLDFEVQRAIGLARDGGVQSKERTQREGSL